jgi:hypothetical protein
MRAIAQHAAAHIPVEQEREATEHPARRHSLEASQDLSHVDVYGFVERHSRPRRLTTPLTCPTPVGEL